ncbi:hypothetical protein [Paenibacillus sp. BAC0078]
MKKFKSLTSTLVATLALTTGLLFPLSQPSYAQSAQTAIEVPNGVENQGIVDLNNLDKLGDGVIVRDVSYDEAMSSIAKDSGITIEEAKAQHPDKTSQTLKGGISTATTDKWVKEISIPQNVTPFYIPTLKIYAWYYSSGSFRAFTDMISVQLDRTNTGSIFVGSKVFGGNLEGKILNSTTIFWLVNGDFFDKGETAISGGLEVGAQRYNVTLTFTYSSNYYQYYYKQGTYVID